MEAGSPEPARDGEADISDGIWTLQQFFREGPAGTCESAADWSDDGVVDITDAIYSFRHRLLGGSVPPAPFPECGVDVTPDPLSCDGAAPCD